MLVTTVDSQLEQIWATLSFDFISLFPTGTQGLVAYSEGSGAVHFGRYVPKFGAWVSVVVKALRY
jgi:hypothetical protein